MRRFVEGQGDRVDGMEYRVRRGSKAENDLVLITRVLEPTMAPMSWLFLMVDFLYENEQMLYPPPRYEGGEFLMKYLRKSVDGGWEFARASLEADKALAAERRNNGHGRL